MSLSDILQRYGGQIMTKFAVIVLAFLALRLLLWLLQRPVLATQAGLRRLDRVAIKLTDPADRPPYPGAAGV